MLRTSERQAFKRCGQRWYWGTILGLRGKQTKSALEFGDLVHQSLAAYYIPGRKRGPKPAKTFKKLYVAHGSFSVREYKDEESEKHDAGDLGVGMLEGYVDEYGDDEDIRIIMPEMPFKIKLTDMGGKPFWYVGRFDALGLWLPTMEYFIFEHKTAATIKTQHLALDEQAGSYWAFGVEYIRTLIKKGLLKKRKLDLEMILYNFLRKSVRNPDKNWAEDGTLLKMNGEPAKNQPPPYFHREPVYRDINDRKRVISRIRKEAYVIRLTEEGKLPVLKNPTQDCHWQCSFHDMCELHETMSDYKSFMEQIFVGTDSYAEYRRDLLEVA